MLVGNVKWSMIFLFVLQKICIPIQGNKYEKSEQNDFFLLEMNLQKKSPINVF